MSKPKRILFIIPYPIGVSPSQRFRFEQYFSILENAGFQYRTESFWSEKTWKILYKEGHVIQKILGFLSGLTRRISMLFSVRKFDYIFLHREMSPVGPPIFEWIISKWAKKRIIYDFDDAIWLPISSRQNKLVSKIKWPSKVKSICRWSYRISCGNDFLSEFASQFNSRVQVVPSTIDTEKLHNPALQKVIKAVGDKVTIGWTGSHSTLGYIQPLVPVIQFLEKKYPGKIRFQVIADTKPDLQIESMEYVQWSKPSEISDLSKLDIGIMPLTDTPWSRGKCGFKILQYMALEIAPIASPVGVNKKIIDDGINGYLCEGQEAWIQRFEDLIHSRKLREDIGKSAREKVIKNYSVDAFQSVFVSLFE